MPRKPTTYQFDLFSKPNDADTMQMPQWQMLRVETRRSVTKLMVSLFLDHVEDERPAISESIADKVQAPPLVGLVGHDDRAPCSQGTFAASPFAHLQLFFGIEAPELLDVHFDTLPLQHHMDAAIHQG